MYSMIARGSDEIVIRLYLHVHLHTCQISLLILCMYNIEGRYPDDDVCVSSHMTCVGDDPMYHKQLAVKKVPRTHANKVIADIIICRSRDNVSKMYKKLE